MEGYGEEPYGEEPYGEEPYGEMDPSMAGYVRATAPRYNPGCPIPTNMAGYEEAVPLEGYTSPVRVSPVVETFKPGPEPTGSSSDAFRPLW